MGNVIYIDGVEVVVTEKTAYINGVTKHLEKGISKTVLKRVLDFLAFYHYS